MNWICNGTTSRGQNSIFDFVLIYLNYLLPFWTESLTCHLYKRPTSMWKPEGLFWLVPRYVRQTQYPISSGDFRELVSTTQNDFEGKRNLRVKVVKKLDKMTFVSRWDDFCLDSVGKNFSLNLGFFYALGIIYLSQQKWHHKL